MSHGDWCYISFADETGFLGGCYVKAARNDEIEAAAKLYAAQRRADGTTLDESELLAVLAVAQATRLGINPGGEAQVTGPLSQSKMDEAVPPGDRERLLNREEIDPPVECQ